MKKIFIVMLLLALILVSGCADSLYQVKLKNTSTRSLLNIEAKSSDDKTAAADSSFVKNMLPLGSSDAIFIVNSTPARSEGKLDFLDGIFFVDESGKFSSMDTAFTTETSVVGTTVDKNTFLNGQQPKNIPFVLISSPKDLTGVVFIYYTYSVDTGSMVSSPEYNHKAGYLPIKEVKKVAANEWVIITEPEKLKTYDLESIFDTFAGKRSKADIYKKLTEQ